MGYNPWGPEEADTTEQLTHSREWGLPGGSVVKSPPAVQEPQETQVQSLGREDSPGAGHSNPVQYSCLENPMDRGAWWVQTTGWQRVGHD